MLAKLVPSSQKVKIEASLEECRAFLEIAKEQAQNIRDASPHGLPKIVRENLKKLEDEWTSIENALAAVFETKNKKAGKKEQIEKTAPTEPPPARSRDSFASTELRILVGEPLRPWQQPEGAWNDLHFTERQGNENLRDLFFEAVALGRTGTDLSGPALLRWQADR